MDRLAPCIMYNPETWDYIKAKLISYGYIVWGTPSIGSIIVTNYCGVKGSATNLNSCASMENRELVTDVEEFLTKAAKFIRYMKKEFTKEDLKSGMLVECFGYLCLVIGSNQGLCVSGEDYWSPIEGLNWDDVTKVWDTTFPYLASYPNPENRKLLYEKKIEKVLTMQEIADKFGIPVEQLRIKK